MPSRVSQRASWILVALILILLCVFLPPLFNVNRYRNQAANAIGRALGHSVTVSNIELKLLPRPGLVLSGFVVAEDPAFGPEPMLRCETVTAYLRLNSLWRGRLEIGTLSLENPSINLVRRADGRWNLEQIVERASQTQSAPTTRTRPEHVPRFPYVEATAGRINFKLDRVKKPFAVSDADLAVWLESDREWGIRLEGRPTRSDVPVGDTGILRMEGRFERAHALRETPFNLKVNFAKGQLGQITAVIYGRDRGWRGAVSATAAFAGTPSALAVTLDTRVDDFRRFDIALGEALNLNMHCTGTYSSIDDSLRGIQCQAPVRPGLLTLRGDVTGWDGRAFDLGLKAEQIPLGRLVALARHTKKDLPEDLTATGATDALITVRRDTGMRPEWSGGGQTTRFALQSSVLKPDLELGPLEYTVAERQGQTRSRHKKPVTLQPEDSSLHVVVQPFAIPLGAPSPATADAYFDLNRYRIELSGDSDLKRLLSVARAMGIGTPPIGLTGPARIDFNIAGGWTGFARPVPSGSLQIHNSTVALPGVLEPLQLIAANVVLVNQTAMISSLEARTNDGVSVTGNANFPLYCSTPTECVIHFDLHAPELSLVRLNRLVNPALQTRPWYALPGFVQPGSDVLTRVQGSGHISIGRFSLGNLIALNMNSNLELNSGTLRLRELSADILGGHHSGNWDLDFTSQPPKYFGSGSVNRVNMTQVFSLLHTPFATGQVSGDYTMGLTGTDAPMLRDSATGSGAFKWTAGSLIRVSLTEQGAPLTFSSFNGTFALQKGNIRCQNCTLTANGTTYNVSGSGGFNRSLSFRLEPSSGPSYVVSGPLEAPVVEPVTTPSTQAGLH